MSEYYKDCIFCKEKIQMSDKRGSWLPYNPDGTPHVCKKQDSGNGKEKEKEKQQSKEAKNEFTLEQVRKKLESIGIIINVERLMKEE
jgi:hypothetical protein